MKNKSILSKEFADALFKHGRTRAIADLINLIEKPETPWTAEKVESLLLHIRQRGSVPKGDVTSSIFRKKYAGTDSLHMDSP